MKSLQDYISIYREIVDKLNITGDAPEVLIQLLANATYISEVDHVVYTQEASLEKASLINSKIQHCMNEMYSVFRGQCPRVLLNFKPTRFFTFNPFDVIVTSNNFKVYYLGYWNKAEEDKNNSVGTAAIQVDSSLGEETKALQDGVYYGPITIPPSIDDETYTIIGLLAKETETYSTTTADDNTYFVQPANGEYLSNDLWVKIDGKYVDVTRNFSDHIIDKKVFDLTIPSFGSRLYIADVLRRSETYNRSTIYAPTNIEIEACWFKYTTLDDYNPAELKKMQLKGAELKNFSEEFMSSRKLSLEDQLAPGLFVTDGGKRDTIQTIHYKANRDRYVNSIIRTNNDVGTVLEEAYPEKVKLGGTSYVFKSKSDEENSSLEIYYVPVNNTNLLTNKEKEDFINTRRGYYVTENIEISKGYQYTAVFTIDLELYASESVDGEVRDILYQYQEKFGLRLEELKDEIRSLISKISNVKQVKNLSIIYISEDNIQIDKDIVFKDIEKTYFTVSYVINSSIQIKS